VSINFRFADRREPPAESWMALQYPLGSVLRVASNGSGVSFRSDAKAALQQAATLTAIYLWYVLDSQIGPRKQPYGPGDVLAAARSCRIPGLSEALEEFLAVSRRGYVSREEFFQELDALEPRDKQGAPVDLEAMVKSIDWLEQTARSAGATDGPSS